MGEQAEALCAEALDACIIAEEKKKTDAAEAPVAKAQEELEEVEAKIATMEQERADAIKKYEAIINDPKKSATKIGVAVADKAALESEDPLPLRKEKITLKAKIKAVKKIKKPLTKARKAAEEALQVAEGKHADAIAYFDKLKSQDLVAHGSIWW